MAQSDILVSAAWAYYAPEGTAEPPPTLAAGAAWPVAWTFFGLTTSPLTLNLSTTEFSVDVQQLSTPVLSAITSEDYTLATDLAEMTAINLQLLFGGNIVTVPPASSIPGSDTLRFGGRTQRAIYKLGFETRLAEPGAAPGDPLLPLRLFFHRTQFSLGGAIAFDKGAASAVPLSVKVLADDSQPTDEKLAVWQKVTASALP
jgi:hypothetical protein